MITDQQSMTASSRCGDSRSGESLASWRSVGAKPRSRSGPARRQKCPLSFPASDIGAEGTARAGSPAGDSVPRVQLFAVACRWPGVDEARVVEALRTAAAAFPELDQRTLERGASPDGRVSFAAVAHPRERTAPRTYFARRGDEVVLYDGLPLPSYDANDLLERWGGLELEGVFSAVKVDLEEGTAEPLTDVFGMAKLFRARQGDGIILSNSVEAVRLLTGATEIDPIGVASMLGFGWTAGGHTLLRGVELVEGPVTPRAAVPRENASALTADDVAQSLTALARSTAEVDPLTCGLTAGRDTRVVLAIALAAGLDVDYYTSGHDADVDVVIARALANDFGLRHELVTPQVPDDWAGATSAFSAQTDGLASFWIVADWVEHQGLSGPVGLKLWGPGGEIGRAGNIGLSIPFGSTTPGLRSSVEVQRRILHRKVGEFGGLVTREAVETTRGYLDRFIADRLEEGWRPREVSEAYYGFERVRYWASAGVRRASVATDLWSPFVSRDFIAYCLSLTPQERSVEAPHWRILGSARRAPARLPVRVPVACAAPAPRLGDGGPRRGQGGVEARAPQRRRGRRRPDALRARVGRGRAARAARADGIVCGRGRVALRGPCAASDAARRAARTAGCGGGGDLPRAHGAVVAARSPRGPDVPRHSASSTPPTAVMLSAAKLGNVMLITAIRSSDACAPSRTAR